MNMDLYERFLFLKNSGKRIEAKTTVDLFVSSFETLKQKQSWVYPFLEAEEYGHKIRHEIYEDVVYPVLLDGYLNHEAKSIVWLAKTFNNLLEVKSLHPLLNHKSESMLFKEAYELEPSEEIRTHLLNKLMSWFHFSQHEWPAGILFGMDGANLEQCEEILQDVEFAKTLDFENKYGNFIADFEAKVREYMKCFQNNA